MKNDETIHSEPAASSISTPVSQIGEHTPGPWGLCNDGKCSCMTVSCADYPIAKVTCGKWGDDYATLELEGGSLDRRVVAVMKQITYGEIYKETAEANARLIAAAPELLEALRIAEPLVQFLFARNPQNAHYVAALIDIHAAISKATGETA